MTKSKKSPDLEPYPDGSGSPEQNLENQNIDQALKQESKDESYPDWLTMPRKEKYLIQKRMITVSFLSSLKTLLINGIASISSKRTMTPSGFNLRSAVAQLFYLGVNKSLHITKIGIN